MFSKMRAPVSRIAKGVLAPRSGAMRNNKNGVTNMIHRTAATKNIRSFSSLDTHKKNSQQEVLFSSLAVDMDMDNMDRFGPMGELFDLKRGGADDDGNTIDERLVGKIASIRRVFGPSANAHGLLTCGGEELARHASFDPDYSRARGWIQNRAIGQAVLSPVLISGLVGALVEAAFPQSVPVNASMHQARPLIVGQEVLATIQVIGVQHYKRDGEEVSTKEKDFGSRQDGDEIRLVTEVIRTQDNEIIAEGLHSVWIPGYLSR